MTSVLDASALLSALQGEPGSEVVAAAIASDATIGAVNLAEVVSKLSDVGMPEDAIHDALASLALRVIDFDTDLAYATGLVRNITREAGLSLGDRACLALARRLGAEAITADRRWANLGLDVSVRLIR